VFVEVREVDRGCHDRREVVGGLIASSRYYLIRCPGRDVGSIEDDSDGSVGDDSDGSVGDDER
jgi:hypothetical protein